MKEKLKEIYKSVILAHDKSPHNFAKRENASHIIDAFNPICGDRFTLYFDMENERVKNISFHGFGCAISKASTSVLVKKMEGMEKKDVQELIEKYLSQFSEGKETEMLDDEELTAFLAARNFPGRLECATLAWAQLDEEETFR